MLYSRTLVRPLGGIDCICRSTTDVFDPVGNDVTYTSGSFGNSTQVDPVYTPGPLPMPEGSRAAVGVFMGLGAAVIGGLLGYYAWTWRKSRSTGAGTPTKA